MSYKGVTHMSRSYESSKAEYEAGQLPPHFCEFKAITLSKVKHFGKKLKPNECKNAWEKNF